MNFRRISLLTSGVLLTVFPNLSGEIVLPKIIGHNMVLQRHKPVPVWGTAARGEKVTVVFGTQHKETITGNSGKWQVNLNPMEASE